MASPTYGLGIEIDDVMHEKDKKMVAKLHFFAARRSTDCVK